MAADNADGFKRLSPRAEPLPPHTSEDASSEATTMQPSALLQTFE